jgi:hypothetical protein
LSLVTSFGCGSSSLSGRRPGLPARIFKRFGFGAGPRLILILNAGGLAN